VFPQSDVSAPAPVRAAAPGGDNASTVRLPIDIRRFPWIRRLAADYAFDYSRVADFFAGNPDDPAAWRAAIARAQQQRRQRDAVADVLEAQQRKRGAPAEALRATVQFRDPRAVAIVTGQQAALFGGPMFTLLKAITAIRLAEQVRAEHGVPAVPIFWIEGEDHDWDEVKACGVLDPDLNVCRVALGDPPGAHHTAVARVRLDESAAGAVAELEKLLQKTEFTGPLLDSLRQAYQPGAGMADAFGRWLEQTIGSRGLVVYDASDPAAKPLVADLFARELETAGTTARLAAEAGDALQAHGYHAQASVQSDTVALFSLNSGREAIRRTPDGFAVGDRTETIGSLVEQARQHPDRFSPNVLLRPLVQDTLFPTACYVAGPNELGYLAQLKGVYGAFGLPMPLIHQRATATVVDANTMKFLTRQEFPFESLRAQDEAALNELLEAQLPASLEASLQDAARAVEDRVGRLAQEVVQVDPTLEGAARSTLTRMQDDLKKLHGKVIQAAKRKDDTLRRQYHHAQALAFPGGHPQEREVGFVSFLNKYGPSLVDRLSEEIPLDMGTHWVVQV
jgi:bacillithiol biosynthesis cysteine-adding enzyme BshC